MSYEQVPITLPARLVIGDVEVDVEVDVYVRRLGTEVQIIGIALSGNAELDEEQHDSLAEEIGQLFPY